MGFSQLATERQKLSDPTVAPAEAAPAAPAEVPAEGKVEVDLSDPSKVTSKPAEAAK